MADIKLSEKEAEEYSRIKEEYGRLKKEQEQEGINFKQSVKEQIKNKFKNVEKIEAVKGEYRQSELVETNYPQSLRRHFLVYENFGATLEESYFWILDNLRDWGYPEVEKIVDTFTASEQSTFFGSAQQRLGIQQDRVSNYLATIGKMVKELFQIVRDIQLLDERNEIYKKAAGNKEKNIPPDDGAEKALKGIWIDFVDNGPGQLKASSVYGLASQIGYTVLPDLFFSAPANLQTSDIGRYIDKLKGPDKDNPTFNDKVTTALVRKLEQYVAWRDATAKQISSKRRFTISYLRQHYNSIKLYMQWVKPYLRNVKRLEMDPQHQLSANLVGAFEGSIVEVEVLAKKPGEGPYPCILINFIFRTRPVMQSGPEFHRGPAHIGRLEMTMRAYTWTEEEIKNFKRIKMAEDFEMLKSIDKTIEDTMTYLGDDLQRYLQEFGEKFGEEHEIENVANSLLNMKIAMTKEEAWEKARDIIRGKARKPSIFEPFTSIWGGFKQIKKGFAPEMTKNKEKKKEEQKIKDEKEKLVKDVTRMTTLLYTNFKKYKRLIVP